MNKEYMKSFFLAIISIILCSVFLYYFDNKLHDHRAEEEIPVVKVYLSNQEVFLQQLFDNFTEETGIKVNIFMDSDENLLQKAQNNKESNTFDLLIGTDSLVLEEAKQAFILQHIDNMEIFESLKKKYYDADHQWLGIARRLRVVLYKNDEFAAKNIMDLKDKKYKNHVLLTAWQDYHNLSLLKTMLSNHDLTKVINWFNNVTHNLSQDSKNSDKQQIDTLNNSNGGIAIVNSNNYLKFLKNKNIENKKKNTINDIQIINTENNYINISALGILKNAKNIKNAEKLIKFLLDDENQKLAAAKNFDLPVIKHNIRIPDELEKFDIDEQNHSQHISNVEKDYQKLLDIINAE